MAGGGTAREPVADWAWSMVGLWRLFQGGGMGVGYLPDAGGAIDQPVIMMRAFAVMSNFEHERTKKDEAGNLPIPTNEDGEVDYAEINRRNMKSLGIPV